MNKRLLSVDPSINDMGCALFELKSKKLIQADLLHPKEGYTETHWDKCYSLYRQIQRKILNHNVVELVIEVPEHWDTAGYMSRESGAIYKLVTVAAMLYTAREAIEVKVVFPSGWKGQLPKDVTKNRLRSSYVPKNYTMKEWKKLNHNVADAIGIGHWRLHGRV